MSAITTRCRDIALIVIAASCTFRQMTLPSNRQGRARPMTASPFVVEIRFAYKRLLCCMTLPYMPINRSRDTYKKHRSPRGATVRCFGFILLRIGNSVVNSGDARLLRPRWASWRARQSTCRWSWLVCHIEHCQCDMHAASVRKEA